MAGQLSLLRVAGAIRAARPALGRVGLATLANGFDYKPGQTLHGFIVQRVQRVPEFDLSAIQLKHDKTGADYLHVAKQDTNNVFNVAFHTPVTDSTGVPHILEHVTLCGSKRYPVRDPFFKMLNRSMATFMNAMTGNDYTMYPFSTENPIDFKNLMDVYMDSTFEPQLRYLDFKQEGWRLEHEDPKNPQSPLIFKGVVYNEMKGALSDLGNLFHTRSQQHLYPNSTYGYNSGGDPDSITNLTHEQLLAFHANHYHPSNARFFTYGSFPLHEHLKAIDERISKFAPLDLEPPADVPLLNGPKSIRLTCPPDPVGEPGKQTKIAVSFLTNKDVDVFESFAVRVLTSLLLDGAAAPMYEALIESKIGTDFAVTTGYNSHTRITNVSFGVQGIKKEDEATVENKIMDVLRTAAQTGFDPERIETVIHQTELGLKHRKANFGMMLGQQVVSHWVHGGDPLEFLQVTEHIARLREEIVKPGFFESRIEKYFLNNKHRLTFVMEPDEKYNDALNLNEKERLNEKIAALSETEKKRIYEEGLKLAESQEGKQDISCLPTLTVNDIAKHGKSYPTENTVLAGTPVQWRKTATNGVSYVSLKKDVSTMPPELVKYLPLYTNALAALGTAKRSLPVLDEAVRKYTGGIGADILASSTPQCLTELNAALLWSSNCLDKNIGNMYDLLHEIIAAASWQELERLQTVVLTSASDANQGIVQSGHRYAMKAAAAGLTKSGALLETLSGLTQVGFLGGLARNGVADVEQISTTLKEISEAVLRSEAATRAAVNAVPETCNVHAEKMGGLLEGLKWTNGVAPQAQPGKESAPTFGKQFFALPIAVNFTAKSYLGVPYTHADGPALQLLSSLMTHNFLHREIREKGGAYGGGASYSPLEGTMSLFSYRDPPTGLDNTLSTYKKAVQWAANATRELGQRELDEAKLSVFQNVDAPKSASDEVCAMDNAEEGGR
ncbi:peptidase M16C associated-domain-containing protein [Fimicolochytrium jonesii]|uniref:peptidase M16C associated-domain-containing protein n=1 Tax=Fimicolochytrium jonesii TaxID=1396493 RepID=UPI0022FEF244|nr:peptidase M16C associated-domain-containing protein [Fimicolochytrium jonesii]KAI8824441.1 peptidase M16C associated-domain-containing protein [Fimicolochytrium jonesii]